MFILKLRIEMAAFAANKESKMDQKRIIFIILGTLAGAVLGAFWGETIKNLGLYSGLGAVAGVCLGWLGATAVRQWQKKQHNSS